MTLREARLSPAWSDVRREGLAGAPKGDGQGRFFVMWMKDSEGNWYLSQQEQIDCGHSVEGSWQKNEKDGTWHYELKSVEKQTCHVPLPLVLSEGVELLPEAI
jgi:hypothetical protein